MTGAISPQPIFRIFSSTRVLHATTANNRPAPKLVMYYIRTTFPLAVVTYEKGVARYSPANHGGDAF